MSDTPPPGSSEWWPGSENDDVTTWLPQPAFTTQRRVAGVVEGGDYVRGSTTYPGAAYFSGAATASTPDTSIDPPTGDFTIVACLQLGAMDATTEVIACQRLAGTQVAWGLLTAGSCFMLRVSSSGTGYNSTAVYGALPADDQLNVAFPGNVVTIAASCDIDDGQGNHKILVKLLQPGGTWKTIGGETIGGPLTLFNSTAAIMIGGQPGGTPAYYTSPIYWVECRTGLDPAPSPEPEPKEGQPPLPPSTLLWRFDPTYWTTGTTFNGPTTDPLDPWDTTPARVWTLSSSTAITPAVVGTDVQQTALRFPTTSTFDQEELTGTGVFFARPIDYGTVELTWGTTLDLSKWGEIAIVRSAFGMPMTVNDGQTLFRVPQSKLYPTGYTMKTAEEGLGTEPVLTSRKLYDPRSMPGASMQAVLPNGRWYYYAMFFRSGTKWHRYMVTSTLLPRNHHHAEHLFNNLPPYYQWTDDQMRGGAGDGDLRKFLKLIGFDFDLTREYVDGWLDLYHTDFTPIPLLRRLGTNFGMAYESGLGDIRYRGLISKIGFLYRSRGTVRSLNEMVVSVMKCSVDVTPSPNTMLLPDDSDFFEGTGSWAGIHPDTPLTSLVVPGTWTVPPTPLVPSKVRLEHGLHVVQPPANSGRGVMRMWTTSTDATSDVLIACGDGIAQDYNLGANPFDRSDDVFEGVRALYPRYAGIPVTPLEIYSFSIKVKSDYFPVTLRTLILWFDANGDSQDLVGATAFNAEPIINTNWKTFLAQGVAPANAAYAVPALWFRNRLAGSDINYSPFIYFTAAQFVHIGTAATVSASSPDRYMTLNTSEKIGPPDPETDFEGFLIGDPTP